MISITCTNCKTVLTIDDAFAGGVCRCQNCGTIQTVPAKKASSRPAAPQSAKPPGPRSLYQTAAPKTTRLDELADAVASSGLARGGLTKPAQPDTPPADSPEQQRRNLLPLLLIGLGALVVLLGIVIAVLLLRPGAPASATGGASIATSGPTFCDIPINGTSVIFLLDRGNSMADLFDTLKATTYKTLAQLGPERQFQVILWDNQVNQEHSDEFPHGQMGNATLGQIDDCRRDFQDVVATGESRLAGPLKEAVERHPQTIVIASGRWDLDDDDMTALRSAASQGMRIHVVQIGNATRNSALQQAASSTGGQFRAVTAPELRALSR